MTHPSLLHQARQGDPQAIAALINAALAPQGVSVKAYLRHPCLEILLRSAHGLNQHATVAFLRQGMVRLRVGNLQKVRAYAWQQGADFPIWVAEFVIYAEARPTPQPGQLERLQELASKGHPIAIALLLNHLLQPRGVTVRAALRDRQLHILLEGDPAPPIKLGLPTVQAFLATLQTREITTARVYSRMRGEKQPAWMESVLLRPATATPLPPAPTPVRIPEIEPDRPIPSATTLRTDPVPHLTPEVEPVPVCPVPAPPTEAAQPQGSPAPVDQRPSAPTRPGTPPVLREVAAQSAVSHPVSPPPGIETAPGMPPAPTPAVTDSSPIGLPKKKLSLVELGFLLVVVVGIYLMVATA